MSEWSGRVVSLWNRPAAALGSIALLVSLLVSPPAAAQAPPAAPAAPEQPVTLTADRIQYNTQTGDVAADGHVKAVRGDTTITSEHLRGNLKSGDLEALGNVVLTEGRRVVTGTLLRYNYKTRLARMDQGVTQSGPWNIRAQEFDFDAAANHGTTYGGALTPCNPQHPAFLITAKRAVVVPGDYITAYDASLYVYGVRVITVAQYTVSLKPGGGKSGPTVGYNSLDGAWIEYDQLLYMGDVLSQLHVRYATISGWSGEGIFQDHVVDHTYELALGRTQVWNVAGNTVSNLFTVSGQLFNLDRYQASIIYDAHPIPGTPLTYGLEGRLGKYYESQSGVEASRGEAILTVTSASLKLDPRTYWAFSTTARYDAYGGVGGGTTPSPSSQSRTVLGGSAAVTYDLRGNEALTLSYNYTSVQGTDPFLWDGVGPDSTVTLNFSFAGSPPLAGGSVYVQYGFLTQQTQAGAGIALAISPSILFSTSASYNISTQTVNEIDYSVRATCDCLTLGALFQTFPSSPSQNAFWITLGISSLPETFHTFKLY